MIISAAFKDYISEPIKRITEKMKLLKSAMLTKVEALQDFESFKYIFDNAYSGKEYFEKKGLIFNTFYDEIENFIAKNDRLSGLDLCEKYYDVLKNKIVDNHLAFIINGERLTFSKLFSAYFTDVLLEKKNDNLFVLSSKIESIREGDIVDCKQNNLFPTLSPKDRQFYLFGKRSWDDIDYINITVNNVNQNIPLHACKAKYSEKNNERLSHTVFDSINIVHTSTFDIDDESFSCELLCCGEKLKNEECVVWNLLSNSGGNSNYPMQFIKGLNSYAHWESHYAVLNSPAINPESYKNEEKAYREWYLLDSEPYDLAKANYKGNLFVLINSKVASSGEAAISYSKSVVGSMLIGENTMGCGNFGDTLTYRLPFSNMMMVVPHKLFLGSFSEGEGFTPDYWVDNNDVQGEVLRWLKDQNEYIPFHAK